jgi:hypothetical protein
VGETGALKPSQPPPNTWDKQNYCQVVAAGLNRT